MFDLERKLTIVILSIFIAAGSAGAALSGVKDSADFAYKWEMDFAPWDTTNYDLDGNGGKDWVQSSSGHFTLADGVLTCTSATSGGLLANDDKHSEAFWPHPDITAATGFTTEFSVKIKEDTGTYGAFKIQVSISDSVRTDSVFFGASHVTYYNPNGDDIVLSTEDNTDGFHVFRLARHVGDPVKTSIWRDEVLIADGIEVAWTASPRRFYIGDIDGSVDGTYDMDYLRIDSGAWAVPEPATLCLLGLGGMLLRRRKV